MKVELQREAPSDGSRIRIANDAVAGGARWKGAGTADTIVDIELEIPGVIQWAAIVVDAGPSHLENPSEGELRIVGVASDLGPDGLLIMTVPGGVILVETSGAAPSGIIGRIIGITAHDARVYSTGV